MQTGPGMNWNLHKIHSESLFKCLRSINLLNDLTFYEEVQNNYHFFLY